MRRQMDLFYAGLETGFLDFLKRPFVHPSTLRRFPNRPLIHQYQS